MLFTIELYNILIFYIVNKKRNKQSAIVISKIIKSIATKYMTGCLLFKLVINRPSADDNCRFKNDDRCPQLLNRIDVKPNLES